MTNAEHNAQINTRIAALRAERAFYDAIVRGGTNKAFAENALEQAARITGYIAHLCAARC